jgi:hypothetical protein
MTTIMEDLAYVKGSKKDSFMQAGQANGPSVCTLFYRKACIAYFGCYNGSSWKEVQNVQKEAYISMEDTPPGCNLK